MTDRSGVAPYDAVLLASFGGPEGPDQVMPFLRRVAAGRNIPDERLAAVGAHYALFGGRSPINDHNRALVAALSAALRARGSDMPVVLGNRHSPPYLPEALARLAAQGARRVVTIVTSAYSSYSSCRAYREAVADAMAGLHHPELQIDKVRPYFDHPGFTQTMAHLTTDTVRTALRAGAASPALLHVTHSIPQQMDASSGPPEQRPTGPGPGIYQRQHLAVAQAVTDEVAAALRIDLEVDLAYCSRSGPPQQRWLEPDIGLRIAQLAKAGYDSVVVNPLGFTADHMEVVYDLDTQASAAAAEAGLGWYRVPTVGTHPGFVAGLVELIQERASEARGETITPASWPAGGDLPSSCATGCCPNPRAPLPAWCGND